MFLSTSSETLADFSSVSIKAPSITKNELFLPFDGQYTNKITAKACHNDFPHPEKDFLFDRSRITLSRDKLHLPEVFISPSAAGRYSQIDQHDK